MRRAEVWGRTDYLGCHSGGNSGVKLTCDGIGTTKSYRARRVEAEGGAGVAHLVAQERHTCRLPGGALCTMAWDGDWLSLNDQDVRGIWGGGGRGVCTSAVGFCWCSFQMHICTSFHGGRYRAQRALALRRVRRRARRRRRAMVSEHMTTNRRPGKTYLAF